MSLMTGITGKLTLSVMTCQDPCFTACSRAQEQRGSRVSTLILSLSVNLESLYLYLGEREILLLQEPDLLSHLPTALSERQTMVTWLVFEERAKHASLQQRSRVLTEIVCQGQEGEHRLPRLIWNKR